MSAPLLPCPFDGATAVARRFGDDDGWYHVVACSECDRAQVHRDTEEAAAAAWNARPALPPREWPPLDDDLCEILGRIALDCVPIANILRESGHEIKPKLEHEQAHALHWLLGLFFAHGKEWRPTAGRELDRMLKLREARPQ